MKRRVAGLLCATMLTGSTIPVYGVNVAIGEGPVLLGTQSIAHEARQQTTAEALKVFLESQLPGGPDEEIVRLSPSNRNFVQVRQAITIDGDYQIEKGIKLEVYGKTTVNDTLRVKGMLHDFRQPQYRQGLGIVGEGSGKIQMTTGAQLFMAPVGEVVGNAGKFKLQDGAEVTLLPGNVLEISKGTVVVPNGSLVTDQMFDKIIVREGAILDVQQGEIPPAIYPGLDDTGANKIALDTAIKVAAEQVKNTAISVDGTDVPDYQKWVTEQDANTLKDAQKVAQAVYDDKDATQEQVDQAKVTLERAITVFEEQKRPGKKVPDQVNLKTAEELANFLRGKVANPEMITLSGTDVGVSTDIDISEDFNIPANVKLQILTPTKLTIGGTVSVEGRVQDSRKPENRTGGLVDSGEGSFMFKTGSSYYQQGVEMVGPNGIIKLGSDSAVAFYGEGLMHVQQGIVTLAKKITNAQVKKITVAESATFNASKDLIAEDIIYNPVGENSKKLGELIALAKLNSEKTTVSEDGADVKDITMWVTPAVKDAYDAAIQKAETVANQNTTEAAYGQAYDVLEKATSVFNNSKKKGQIVTEEIKTAEQLVGVLNELYGGVAAQHKGAEFVDGKTYQIVEVNQPIHITHNITIPEDVRFKLLKKLTVDAEITVKGQLQDFRDEGYIIGSGVVGANGTGRVVFEPGSYMYIKGKGQSIGVGSSAKLSLEDNAKVALYAKNKMEILEGDVATNQALVKSLTEDITVTENATLTAYASIPSGISIKAVGQYVDATTLNQEAQLGMVGTVVETTSPSALRVALKDDRVYIDILSKETMDAEVSVTNDQDQEATIELSLHNGAVIEKNIVKHGSLSREELKRMIAEKTAQLKELVSIAEEKGLDAEREKGTLWFAEQFDIYADWDEENIPMNQKMFGVLPAYSPLGKTAEELAKELPEFERKEIIAMLDTSIDELTDVIDGTVVRRDVNLVDWDGITVEGGNFISNGKPVFLHDYFSKPLDVPTNDPTLYNHYLGNIDKPKAISPAFIQDNKGSLVEEKMGDLKNRPTKSNGYTMFWHDPVPNWALNEHGVELKDGTTTFTKYDINSPVIRDIWDQVLGHTTPVTANQPYTTLGYCLANEPHWYLQEGHWAVPKKADGTEGISDNAVKYFEDRLEEMYNDIDAMNTNWGTSFSSFEAACKEVIPLPKKYQGTPVWYDICKINMERGTDWLGYLHSTLKQYDENAMTHLKIMPDLFAEGNRTHGIDFETLTEMTEFIGDDAKIRKENVKATGASEDWNEDYAYYWKEMAMTYDFMSSVSPEKAHVNSEVHFLSTVAYRDLYMKPEYVRSAYWFATVLGMDAGFTWFWGRQPSGAIENRLMTTDVQGLLESYPGSVAQQPRVANELSKTMMDLNAFSQEIAAFQEQRKPIRMFYSETSAINDEMYMEHLFELYEKLYFDGIAVGFATENILEKQDMEQWDVVTIYHTPRVTDAEFEAIQNHINEGGKVIVDEKSLKYDEYGKERKEKLVDPHGNLVYMTDKDVKEIAQQTIASVKDKPGFTIEETNGLTQKGSVWRAIETEENTYVTTVMNIGKNTASLELEGDIQSVVDMMTGRQMGSTLQVESEGVMLLQITLNDNDNDNDDDDDDDNGSIPNNGGSGDNGENPEKDVHYLSDTVVSQAIEETVDGTAYLSVEDNKVLAITWEQVEQMKKHINKVEVQYQDGTVIMPIQNLMVDEQDMMYISLHKVEEDYRLIVERGNEKGEREKISQFDTPVTLKLPYDQEISLFTTIMCVDDLGNSKNVGGITLDKQIATYTKQTGLFEIVQNKVVFEDVSSEERYYQNIMSLAAKGYIVGIDEDKFAPQQTMTRAQFVTLLNNIIQVQRSADGVVFEDVEQDMWYAQAIHAFAEAGIISGVGDNKFAPEASISEQDMMIIITNTLKYLNNQAMMIAPIESSGYETVSDYAKDAVYTCTELGIIDAEQHLVSSKEAAQRDYMAFVVEQFMKVALQ